MKLLIVDDASAVYRRLIELLGGVERLTALSIARSLHDMPAKCREFQPDTVVLDIDLPDGKGLDAIRIVKTICPGADLFIFSNHVACRDMALAEGADGFYDKSLEFEQLVKRLLPGMPAMMPFQIN
jgi:two-component system nitrate/nitrite response regulator NarL